MTSYDRALAADAFLPKGASSPAELLDRIKVLVARKRGPKKHVPRPVEVAREEADRMEMPAQKAS